MTVAAKLSGVNSRMVVQFVVPGELGVVPRSNLSKDNRIVLVLPVGPRTEAELDTNVGVSPPCEVAVLYIDGPDGCGSHSGDSTASS